MERFPSETFDIPNKSRCAPSVTERISSKISNILSESRCPPGAKELISSKTSTTHMVARCASGPRNGSTVAEPSEALRSMTRSPSQRAHTRRVGSDVPGHFVPAPTLSAPPTLRQKRDATRPGSTILVMPSALASSSIPPSSHPTPSSRPDRHSDFTITPPPLATALEDLLHSSPAVVSDDPATTFFSHALAAAFQTAVQHSAPSDNVHFDDRAHNMTSESALDLPDGVTSFGNSLRLEICRRPRS